MTSLQIPLYEIQNCDKLILTRNNLPISFAVDPLNIVSSQTVILVQIHLTEVDRLSFLENQEQNYK